MQEILDEPVFVEENELPPLIEIEEDMPLNELDKAWIREAVNGSKENVARVPALVPFWQKYGTMIAAAITVCASIGLPLYFHYSASNSAVMDEHTNILIGAKLEPAKQEINGHIDAKTGELSTQIGALSQRVAHIEGSLDKRVSNLETRTDRQSSLARLMDPNRALALVRAEIEMAETKGKPLGASTLADYKNVVLELPSSSYQYWTTVAAIINYQSKLNQMAGEAPDPNKVSKPCVGLTNGGRFHASGNAFINLHVSGCYIDLESAALVDSVIENSVVRYYGGPTNLKNVTFVNCTFLVNFAPTTKPSKSSPLVLALLNSPKQSSVTVP
jgi:hypothetical protein